MSEPFILRVDSWSRLLLIQPDGTTHTGVEVVRCFPISDPTHGIAVLDAAGREVVWIDNLQELPPEIRQTIDEKLRQRDFMPQLLRVLSVSGVVEPTEWEVETDRGKTRFTLNSEDDIHCLTGRRALIVDANGIRYLIPDIAALDARSRRLLERFL